MVCYLPKANDMAVVIVLNVKEIIKLLNMRKQLLLGALTAFGLTLSMQVSAQQNFTCGNPEQLRKLYAANPQMEADYYKLINKYKQTIHGEKNTDTTIYRIPIVFHVIHEYGAENITDAQILDEMDILNIDYRKLNADTAAIVPAFDTLAGDARIQFVLPSIDPWGNCTNGIEHIYNHQTNKGDDYSKLHQWNRSEYLNVWVVNTIGAAGVAGYAYYPGATIGGFFFADGIIILNDYIGSIGTSAPFSSRALTHEIGHYLGLSHTWGNTNDPGVACGDDQSEDTPITKGHNNCSNVNDATCNPGIIENVQNFMEYSYCSNMFTFDQIDWMRNTLITDIANRDNLWTDSNLTLVGALSAPLCAPVADFSVTKRMICAGDNVTFKNASWNATVDTYEWSFPGGSPATSTAANPTVTYATEGFYTATLTVTNATGSSTKTFNNVVYASPTAWTEHIGPAAEDFNSSQNFWISENPEENHAGFNHISTNGKDMTGCFKLNNYKDISSAQAFTEDYFYYDRLGNSKDYLTSPSYDLSTTTGVTVSFDYAYGTKGTTLADITEVLKVYSSRDCGKTWTLRKTIDQEELLTAGYVGNTDFAPTTNAQWKTASFTYATAATDVRTRFRFEYTASDFSSNFYFDNFNVSGTLGIEENGATATVAISPNPVSTGTEIAVEVTATTSDMSIQLVDMNGSVVSTTNVQASNGTQTVMIPMNVSKGCYFLNAIQGNTKTTHKVVVF
jgi:PKD repeat protein